MKKKIIIFSTIVIAIVVLVFAFRPSSQDCCATQKDATKQADTQTVISTSENDAQKDVVEVIYFHSKKRCITCNAIEKLAKEVVENDYADAYKNGEIVFKTIDISQKENKEIATKYEITWSSLLINRWKDGKETVNNMTNFAFSTAKNTPDDFKKGVKEKIAELLKL